MPTRQCTFAKLIFCFLGMKLIMETYQQEISLKVNRCLQQIYN